MIPKIIHYCWLSDDPIPSQLKKYIEDWSKIMPDYKVKKWDQDTINLDDHPFAKHAFDAKKYAFAADYIRVYALYNEGGIYLDSDVLVLKSFDKFLSFGYFTSFENHWRPSFFKMLTGRYIDKRGNRYENIQKVIGVGLQAAIMGSEAQHPILKDLWEYYSFLNWSNDALPVLAPYVYARIAERYGFKYFDKLQFLENNIVVFSSDVFATKGIYVNNNTHAIHMIVGSWVGQPKNSVLKMLKKNDLLMDIYLRWKIIFKSQK